MHFLDIILKKRNGLSLKGEEIQFFVESYVKNEIPDYQVAALLMAIWFAKMDDRETAELTFAMRDSGDVINLSDIEGPIADKHSTGGVADTTTLVVAPVVAACGIKIAKMSGRGLGHTGGTIDKLESIPGFQTEISMDEFKKILTGCGLAVVGQTKQLVPADKLLYALRDVTGTVDNVSLIASSIMSKKLASGADTILLDVKCGNGSFLKNQSDAELVAKSMVNIGKTAGKKTTAMVTDMNQPLGMAIGNALEVHEAIQILRGEIEGELKDVSTAIASNILLSSGKFTERSKAETIVQETISSGRALERLKKMIEYQKGDVAVCDDLSQLPTASHQIPVVAEHSGYITKVMTDQIGFSALLLGAGRVKKGDEIDPAVGIWMKKRLGDKIEKGEELAMFHVNSTKNLETALNRFTDAITVSSLQAEKSPLIYTTIN